MLPSYYQQATKKGFYYQALPTLYQEWVLLPDSTRLYQKWVLLPSSTHTLPRMGFTTKLLPSSTRALQPYQGFLRNPEFADESRSRLTSTLAYLNNQRGRF